MFQAFCAMVHFLFLSLALVFHFFIEFDLFHFIFCVRSLAHLTLSLPRGSPLTSKIVWRETEQNLQLSAALTGVKGLVVSDF